MTALTNVGIPPAAGADLVDNAFIAGLIAANSMTQSQIDPLVAAGFAPFMSRATLTQKLTPTGAPDQAYATTAQVDAGDATRVQSSTVGTAGGPVPLNTAGRLSLSQVSGVTVVQRFPELFISPSAYNSGVVSATGTAAPVIYSFNLPNPGYAYQPWISGLAELYGSTGASSIQILANNPAPGTGQLIASASTLAGLPVQWGVDNFARTSALDLGGSNYWTQFEYVLANGTFGQNNTGGQYSLATSGTAAWAVPSSGYVGVDSFSPAIRSYASDALTASDYQRVRVVIKTPAPTVSANSPVRLFALGRVASDQSSMVGLQLMSPFNSDTQSAVGGSYVTSGGFNTYANSPVTLASSVNLATAVATGDVFDFFFGHQGNPNEYVIKRNGAIVWSTTATGPVVGTSNRNWGFAGLTMVDGYGFGTTYLPPTLSSIQIMDPQVSFTVNDYADVTPSTNYVPQTVWMNSGPVSDVPILSGAVTCYVVLRPDAAGDPVNASTFLPSLQVALLPATAGISDKG